MFSQKIKKIFTNWRVILLVVCLIFALIAIHPVPNAEGVAIRTVLKNSTALDAGMMTPKPTVTPTGREVITSINNIPIEDKEDYFKAINEIYSLPEGTAVRIITNKQPSGYSFETEGEYRTVTLNGTEKVLMNITENNETVERYVTVPKTKQEFVGIKDIGLKVYDAPNTNIRKGLDLEGGTRVLLEPESEISDEDFAFLLSNMNERLNVYGLSDVVVKKASDLEGKEFIIVEIAGANEQEVKELLAKQGKFEAKINNNTVFIGGKDITYVAKGANEAGIDPMYGCNQIQDGWMCRFRFGISMTPEAARKQADATRNLKVLTVDEMGQPLSKDNRYLDGKIDFYLDDQLSDSLNIGADLQGKEVTEIQISGSGVGKTQQEAMYNSIENMKRLQTILQTGSLPVKLNIVKTDTISPMLGEEFINNALLVALFAILSVSIVIFFTYRKWVITLPIVLTMTSEIIMILGLAAIFKWNLDLAAIAGILISVGTGVDHLIIITDETLKSEASLTINWTDRLKNAFFIIIGAFSTMVAAMIPLWWVGVGMLKGFALTTVFGLLIGIFIARSAYAAVIEILLK